ncbi:uncharacterized protein LOC132202931 isoform X2 [Neocloeon triangulifer]|nr:uncharacterized protein LOC132202931 isoform X2 [Neocloeon triangulifer]XP_059486258.1 uncharacterized protein LOC132202931 isoform X2 [Neocloeon triangulifer]
MAARGAWVLRSVEEKASLGRLAKSTLALAVACALSPLLLLSFLGVSIFRRLYCWVLEKRFPGVEPDCSPSVRAATDTRRNQAIVTLLAHFKGTCDLNLVRNKIKEEILEQRNSEGELVFARLRAVLSSRWGHYVWIHKPNEFQIDSHVVLGGQLFRGRPLTDGNIQDYVSDIVSKCLPVNLPPWQVVLIPVAASGGASTGDQQHFYALLRLHHLLVAECGALRDLLAGDWGWGQPLVPRPHAIPTLIDTATTAASNAWHSLREEKDPAVKNKALHRPLLDTLAAVLVFVAVDACDVVLKTEPWHKLHLPSVWINSLRVQADRRKLTLRRFAGLTAKACYPVPLLAFGVRALSLGIHMALQTPLFLLRTARDEKTRALLRDAVNEVIFWLRVSFDGPRIVLEEFFTGTLSPPPVHLSLCGRRVVAWSEPVSVKLVERIAEASESTPAEVLLAAASSAVREHYRKQGCAAPAVPVQPLGSSGVLLLPPPADGEDCVDSLFTVKQRIAANRHQPTLLLASAWLRNNLTSILPSLTVRLVLNCVTRRYATIVMTSAPTVLRSGHANLWGYTADSVLLWRPPQANISVSLSVVRLGESVRLAVMADQQLWPHHAALPAAFLAQLKEMASSLQVRNPAPRNSPPPGPSTIPALLRLEEETLVD